MKITFGSKADTLERLSSIIKKGKILPIISFTVAQWENNNIEILKKISTKNWTKIPLIIRSSSLLEDKPEESHAGHFSSVQNCNGEKEIIHAVEKVISSYKSPNPENQVFIQPLCIDIKISGVAFSIDPNTGSPYYVINFDDSSGSTTSVTSGSTNQLKTFYYYKFSPEKPPEYLHKVIELLQELENVFECNCLDIEFAVTNKKELFLFQVRKLICPVYHKVEPNEQSQKLKLIAEKIKQLNQPHPYLHGKKTVFGIMPDWNPAEIIGVKPRTLALSLYKEIITDNIWAYQRDNYGYKNLRSFPLLINFFGLPYIDVRVSFNSFIPSDISDTLSNKLVNYYIKRLTNVPSYHDKVEFEIIFSCYTFDLPERLSLLKKYKFSQKEISTFSESLKNLTNRIIHGQKGLWLNDIEKIKILESKRETVLKSNLDTISKIYWLLEDCKRFGTLPFAGLARAAFIAIQILKSLISVGILSKEDYDIYLNTLDTTGTKIGTDFVKYKKNEFLEKYGHLRPGTYNILSPRYDEEPERYFDWEKRNKKQTSKKTPTHFSLTIEQLKSIRKILFKHGMEQDVLGLFDFIKAAIEGREYSKFVFTKSLSDILSLIKKMGEEFRLNKEDCSFMNISIIKELYDSSTDVSCLINQSIRKGKENYELTKQILLPPLIINPEDVWGFFVPTSEPNFITIKICSGKVCFEQDKKNKLQNGILMIPSADPGYDWIFSYPIAGFITLYGGANSHMAIRAQEIGIPAVVGAGEYLFNLWKEANVLEMDCLNKQVKIIS